MTKYLAGVLSVIAVGVLLIAYGLLSPRVGAFASPADFDPYARPVLANQQGVMPNDPYASRYGYGNPYVSQSPYGFNYPAAPQVQPAVVREVRPVRTVTTTEAPRRVVTQAAPRRDWKKTAMIIGGSTAGAAGIGGIFGGKKGALIGAAIGGGASSIYEATKKPGR